jgi:ring-1,2-phenylacetyl-CoA epoxidase subunit PaaC
MSDPNAHLDSAYEAIIEHNDESRWAFGTGFTDPLAGIDTTVSSDIDAAALAAYCWALGDDALILSHRLQEWVYRAPELEEETALANIALDLLGQARMLLARAGRAEGGDRDEDDLAFRRSADQFANVTLAEIPDGDFASCIARLLVFSVWRLALFARLRESVDPVLAAIAAKGAAELTYHRDYAAEWVVRLGDGTVESADRMGAGLVGVAPYVEELFADTAVEQRLPDVAVQPPGLRDEVLGTLGDVLLAATLDPLETSDAGFRGRVGRHTDALAPLLDEMQSVARAHPGATW